MHYIDNTFSLIIRIHQWQQQLILVNKVNHFWGIAGWIWIQDLKEYQCLLVHSVVQSSRLLESFCKDMFNEHIKRMIGVSWCGFSLFQAVGGWLWNDEHLLSEFVENLLPNAVSQFRLLTYLGAPGDFSCTAVQTAHTELFSICNIHSDKAAIAVNVWQSQFKINVLQGSYELGKTEFEREFDLPGKMAKLAGTSLGRKCASNWMNTLYLAKFQTARKVCGWKES